MNTKLFVKWLVEVRGLKQKVAENRVSNCNTIEKLYGDLEEHYYLDNCITLLDLIKYTKKDEKENRPPNHIINIKGNVFNGTQTYRQALKKYLDFMNHKTREYA